MKSRAVRGLIFDKDGTLFDFRATWEVWAASFLMRATDGDVARATEVGRQVGFDFPTRTFLPDSIIIAGTPAEIVSVLCPQFPEYDPADFIEMLNTEAGQAPQVEAVPLKAYLSGLKSAGLAIGVATNDAERPARAHLSKAGVLELFDFVAGYDSGYGGKPAPGQLLAFCEQMDLPPERVAMVGDSLHDLHAGRAAGMRTIGVLTGMAKAAELAPMADVVLPDIGHIPNWLLEETTV